MQKWQLGEQHWFQNEHVKEEVMQFFFSCELSLGLLLSLMSVTL